MEQFFVYVTVMPYVRKYLTDNFRVKNSEVPDLCDIRGDALLAPYFIPKLKKKSYRRESQLQARNQQQHRRTCRVPLLISKETFRRCGWSLSQTDEAALIRVLEIRCRTILLGYLTSLYMVTGNLSLCINKFYDRFGYDDEIWPVDSIRKIWLRCKNIPKKCVLDDYEEKFLPFFVETLSKTGTMCQLNFKDNGNY